MVSVTRVRLRAAFTATLVGVLATTLLPAESRASAPANSATSVERPQANWNVATSSRRGVMVDYRMLNVAGVEYRAIRLRARTTLLRWHVGAIDPPTRAGEIPPDAGSSINWPNEGLAGVVAVFNGGFKVGADGGGSMVDGLTLSPLVRGDMTLAINAAGHWKMGLWEPNFPGPSFHAIAYRQNLGPLIANGKVTNAALYANPLSWGSPLNNLPLQPRSALGIDARGDLLYVATMTSVSPGEIGRALLSAGAREGMELDINPYWPILGASFHVLHAPGDYPVQIPYSEHNPTIYNTGWERDFFVAMAEPNAWNCEWASSGLGASSGVAQPQPLREACTH